MGHSKRHCKAPLTKGGKPAAATIWPLIRVVLIGTSLPLAAAGQPGPTASATSADRIGILPLVNITGNAADDWIGIGIAETLATQIERTGRGTVTRDNGRRSPVDDDRDALIVAGRQLGVRWIVGGSYQRVGDQLRMITHTVEVATGQLLHSARVDGQVTDLFALQDQLVTEVGNGLDTRLGRMPASSTPEVTRSRPTNRPSTVSQPSAAETLVENTRAAATNLVETIDGPPPPAPPATINRDADGRATVRSVRLTAPLRIDGNLDESVYETVEPLTGFLQQLPDEGAPATERTEAWVFFDDDNVYVSARLWDSAPESQWVANEMQRDSFQLINNERFSVQFDTYYDRRNGVAFVVNPIGGIVDFEITDEGSPNLNWNPVWDVQTGRFDGGWTAEMEIPFKAVRFRPGIAQVWGMQLSRRIRWKNEFAHLTLVPRTAMPGEFRISAAGTLTGLEVPSGNRAFEIKPYAIGTMASDFNAAPIISNQGDGNFGVDAKYGVTQNLTADFTYNTDFAQVEVDEQQVNLTRFSLFFPEKREFFLEASGTFDFGQGASFGSSGSPGGGGRRGGGGSFRGGGDKPTIFFSRRIGLEGGQTVPILGGGRLTGKTGDFTVGALSIQTDDLLSGGATAGTNFTVMRIKRDILRRSRIGGIFTGRSVSAKGSGTNQVYGLDAAFSLYENVNFNGYYAKSQTPGLSGDDASYQTAFTYNGDLFALQVDHLLVGDNFNPEIGFMRRDDFRRTFTTAQYSPRPSGIEAVRQFIWRGSLDYITSGSSGLIETRIGQASFQTEFENSDRLNLDVQDSYELLEAPFQIASDVTIPVGGYDFRDYFVSYALGQQRRFSGTVSFQRGEFFSGDITAVGYQRGRIEVTPQFSVQPGISINRIELPQGRFTAKLVTSRLTYTLTPRMFFSGFVQYNSSTDSLSSNLRLRWEYQPGSELFVVYNDVRDTELRSTPMLENRAFIIKFTRLFRF